MTSEVDDVYMARTFLAQAAASRHHPGWHARLLEWAAARRRRHAEALKAAAAPPAKPRPAQGDLFEDPP